MVNKSIYLFIILMHKEKSFNVSSANDYDLVLLRCRSENRLFKITKVTELRCPIKYHLLFFV